MTDLYRWQMKPIHDLELRRVMNLRKIPKGWFVLDGRKLERPGIWVVHTRRAANGKCRRLNRRVRAERVREILMQGLPKVEKVDGVTR